MNNRKWLTGIAALALLSVLTLGACDNPSGGGGGGGSGKAPNTGGDLKIDFAAVAGEKAFTLTLATGEWKTTNASTWTTLYAMFAVSDGTDSFADLAVPAWATKITSTCVRQSDPKVLKVTFTQNASNTGSFKIDLAENNNAMLASLLISHTSLSAGDLQDTNGFKTVTIGTNDPLTIAIP